MEDLLQAPNSSGVTSLVELLFGSPRAPLALPAARHGLDPEKIRRIAGVDRLAELGRREILQVSPDALLDPDRFVHLLRQSIENRCLLWFFETQDEELLSRLHDVLPSLIHRLDTSAQACVWGVSVHQVVLHILHADDATMRSRLAGVDISYLHRRLRAEFPHANVPSRRSNWFVRRWRDPRTWLYLIVFLYSSLRALPVVFVPQFHGNVWILWAIDVLTAIPYTWGILAMITATRPVVRAIGTVTSLVTFAAPYVYFWQHGNDYPPLVIALLIAMIVGSIAVEVLRWWQERSLTASYAAGSR